MRRAGLMTRLAKLERRQMRRAIPKLVFALDDREHAGEITGYRLGNVTFLRRDCETAEEALTRAFELQPDAASAAALYGPQPVPECGQDTLSGHSNPKRG